MTHEYISDESNHDRRPSLRTRTVRAAATVLLELIGHVAARGRSIITRLRRRRLPPLHPTLAERGRLMDAAQVGQALRRLQHVEVEGHTIDDRPSG